MATSHPALGITNSENEMAEDIGNDGSNAVYGAPTTPRKPSVLGIQATELAMKKFEDNGHQTAYQRLEYTITGDGILGAYDTTAYALGTPTKEKMTDHDISVEYSRSGSSCNRFHRGKNGGKTCILPKVPTA